jgi:hypothetical protein
VFDGYVQSEDGNYINTLWDHWYSRPGEGRKTRIDVISDLHRAQEEADTFICYSCGYSGRNERVAFYKQDAKEEKDDNEDDSKAEEEENDNDDNEEEEDVEACNPSLR